MSDDEMKSGEQVISVVVGTTMVVRRIPPDTTLTEIRRMEAEMREQAAQLER